MIDPEALGLLLAANGAPVAVTMLLGPRAAWPLDGGRHFVDGRPLLGPHKTWRGLASGLLAATAAGSALGAGPGLGATFGALALGGDLVSSFLKRRLDRPPGRETLLLDQVPESLLPLVVLQRPLGLDAAGIGGTAVLFAMIGVAASRLLRRPSHRREGSR